VELLRTLDQHVVLQEELSTKTGAGFRVAVSMQALSRLALLRIVRRLGSGSGAAMIVSYAKKNLQRSGRAVESPSLVMDEL
jgi:hypothetical protein